MTLSSLKKHISLLVILLVYVILATYTGWREPLTEGPDEAAHFMYARFLEKEGRLPLTPEARKSAGYKSDQPPLYGLIVAGLYGWKDLERPPFVKLAQGIPRRHLVTGADNVNSPRVIRTEDPLAGELRFWYFGRWLSTLFGAASLVVVYAIARQVFAGRSSPSAWATAAVASVAFIPSFVFISAVFNYESLLGLWLALYLLVAVYLLRHSEPVYLYFLAGLFVGLALVTKLSALLAPFGLIGLVLAVGYRAGWPKRKYLLRLAVACLGVFMGAGWWFGLVIMRLNRIAELGLLPGLLQPIIAGDGSDRTASTVIEVLSGRQGVESANLGLSFVDLWRYFDYLFRTFWSFPWQGPQSMQVVLIVILCLITAGLIRTWRSEPTMRLWIAFFLFHTLPFLLLPVIRFIVTGLLKVAGQGHHILFPALGAVAVLMTLALGANVPTLLRIQPRWRGGFLLGAVLLLWGLMMLPFGRLFERSPLPVRTVPPFIPASVTALDLDFGSMRLAGYELHGLSESGVCCAANVAALGLNLYWRAEEFAAEDYRSVVSLIDHQGQARSVWAGYPASGRYPQRAWEPGEVIREEMWLPLAGVPPGNYRVELELVGKEGPLVVDNQPRLELTQVEVAMVPPGSRADKPYHLWQRGRIVDTEPVFGSRATVQITAASGAAVKLIGPDQIEHEPVRSAGQVHNFIVDPLWSSGAYQLVTTSAGAGESGQQSEPLLEVRLRSRQTTPSPSQVTVEANFADQIQLLGYDLPERHLQAGQALPVTLRWRALHPLPTDFIMFTHIRDQTGQQVGAGRDRWPQEVYSPLLWVPGEVVEDSFSVEIGPDIEPGVYYLDVGWYWPTSRTYISLPLVQNDQMGQITAVSIGPFEVGDVSLPGILTESPQPRTMLNQPFGDAPNLTLLGYDLTDETGQPMTNETMTNDQLPITNLHLTLYWRTETHLPTDYTTFVHLRNEAGEVVAQKDQPPLAGAYPTSLWEPGEIIADEVRLSLPPDLPPGDYRLFTGLYDFQTGQRLVVPGNPANEIVLMTIGE